MITIKFLGMNEYIIRYLRKWPRVKGIIKRLYVFFWYILHWSNRRDKSGLNLKEVHNERSQSSFFGYYDLPIENSTGDLVYCVTNHDTKKPPRVFDNISIALHFKENNDAKYFTTRAFNWQQGARQHWFTDRSIIYNDFDGENYISRIYDIDSKLTTTVPIPVQCSAGGRYIFSIDYSRLSELRPDYGYFAHRRNKDHALGTYAILEFDLKNAQLRELVSFEQLATIIGEGSQVYQHKVNHLVLSPDRSNLLFLYRRLIGGVRYDYLFTFDRSDGRLRHHCTGRIVSHYCWVSNEEILAYMEPKNGKLGFYKIDLSKYKIERIDALRNFSDGHPTFSDEKILLDTYPDKGRFQHLFSFNLMSEDVELLGSYKQPIRFYNESRCDLHPRVGLSGDVYFDSCHSGIRKLYKLDWK